MALVDLLNREMTVSSRRDAAIAIVVSGAANAVILAVINAASLTASYEELNARFLAMFLVAMALYVIGFKYTFDTATQVFEQMLTKTRVRLVEKIADSELLLLHYVGKARIFQSITQGTAVISESQGLLVAAGHSAVMLLFAAIYVLTLSLPAFLTIVAVVMGGVSLYLAQQQEMTRLLQRSVTEEVCFIGMTNDLIDGLKEVKLSRARGREMLSDIEQVAVDMRDIKIEATNLYNKNAVFSQCFFYVLIAIIVFFLPRLVEGFAVEVPRLVAAILFIIGPLSTIVTASPAFTKANRAAEGLIQLEGEINRMLDAQAPQAGERVLPFNQAVECHDLQFHYPGGDPVAFRIGPINLKIPKGQITMIIGGNGSGKTTFLKVLAGLYPLSSGSLTVDGALVTPDALQGYREMFSAIYNDFHLFRKLYGVVAEADAIAAQLARMGIAGKVGYGAAGFSTLDLSTGQRKRIAMTVTLLEDRPVMIFDEWAADQDPDFRRYFYEVLLPELKAQGKTLLIATHDDRYFYMADMVVKMEMGNIAKLEGKT